MVARLTLEKEFFFTKSGVQCGEMLVFFSISSKVGLMVSPLYSGNAMSHGLLKKPWVVLMHIYL